MRSDANLPVVIVVNDQATQLRMLSAIIAKENVHVVPCEDAATALGIMERAGAPALIVTDLSMPGIDGWRFCRLMRSQEYAFLNSVPVLIISATFSGGDAREVSLDLGANGFLGVPVDARVLRSHVCALLRGDAPKRVERVLIVEDSPAQAKIMQQGFETRGYAVSIAPTGMRGRQLFRQRAYDIVILDYHLPDMTGDMLIEEFKPPGTHTVVIMATTDPTPALATRLLRMGVDAYVRKPFDPDYLVDVAAKTKRQHSFLRVESLLDERTRALERAVGELERSNAALQEFAYVVSHDLQAPLRMVSSYVRLLERRYTGQLDEAADDFIRFVVQGAERMRDMIEALLIYSRVKSRSHGMASTDLNEVMEATLSNLQLAIEEGEAQITCDEMPTVTCDAPQLIRVFQNLVANAIKFRGDAPAIIHIGVRRDDAVWELSVRDNGIGIAEDAHEKVFGVFHRLHSRQEYEGTGIGLAICKRVITHHGGRIWIESEPGIGTTVFFTLPATD